MKFNVMRNNKPIKSYNLLSRNYETLSHDGEDNRDNQTLHKDEQSMWFSFFLHFLSAFSRALEL